MSTQGPTKLWAVADVFESRLQSSLANLKQGHEKQVDVPPERQFIGMDAYKKAIDSLDKGDVVLLTTPPGFRPLHFDYAVQKGVNVFMEKSFAVDGPGVRRVLKAGEAAKQKNLKVAGGLMSRHYTPLEEAIQHVHDGMIGELVTVWAYRMHGPVGLNPRQPGMKELAYQIANYSCFTWLNGTFLEDWLIHNIDVCCWAKDAWPASVQGMGGRQVRKDPDQLFDHYAAEYTFPDGTRFVAEGRHIASCFDFWGAILQGAKGSAIMGEGQDDPRLFKGWNQTSENLIWRYKGPKCDRVPVRARSAVRRNPQRQALQRGGALRQDLPDLRHGPHGLRIGQEGHLGRGPGVQHRAGARAGRLHVGFQSAGHARCQRPVPHRHAGPDTGGVRSGSKLRTLQTLRAV